MFGKRIVWGDLFGRFYFLLIVKYGKKNNRSPIFLFFFCDKWSYQNFYFWKCHCPKSLTILVRYILYLADFPKKEERGHRRVSIEY